MKRLLFFTAIFYAIFLTFVSYRVSSAYFSDMAVSQTNTFTAATEFSVTPPENPEETTQTVVINEIMWMGSAESDADEWIELRNMTGSPITMTTWTVENLGDGTPNIQFSGTIPANGYFLIANYAETVENSVLNITPDVVNTGITLLEGGEQLVLKDNANNVIDTANATASWLSGVNGSETVPNRSMERKSSVGDGTSGSNWHNSNGQSNLDTGSIDFATPKTDNSSGL